MNSKRNVSHSLKELNHNVLSERIKELFRITDNQDFDINKIKRKLAVSNHRDQINEIVKKLLNDKYITFSDRGKYIYNNKTNKNMSKKNKQGEKTENKIQYTGIVDKTKTGSAYIIIEDLNYDVFVPNRYMMTALDGDTVKIELLFSKSRNKKDGKIIEIISRTKDQFVGIYRSYSNYAIVFVESAKDEIEIFVPSITDTLEINDGDKVMVEISEWRGRINPVPWGNIISVMSPDDKNDVEMKSILINNGFSPEFPSYVIDEAAALDKSITEEEIRKRRDFRGITTFTIDPDTARDFDDALSYRELDNGNVEIGVHIADVSHFVRPGTHIDKEAYKRSTSVYLVDRVAPMLPEELSNELCSLRPDEGSLTFSAVFEFNKNMDVVKRWFGKTIIHSQKRFTYEEAQEIIDKGDGQFVAELGSLNKIAKKLRNERFSKGSIDFQTDEVKFILDDSGNPVDVFVKETIDTNMLIEEFMLLANKEVATYIVKNRKNKKIPFVFRIHDLPDPDKLSEFAAFAKEFGLKLKLSTPKQVVSSYNSLNIQVSEDERLKFLIPLALRTMAKAVYSTDNIGHFGLGFDNYTHFTSPIRRYSDILVHRILEEFLNRAEPTKINELEDKCRHISEQERKAVDAERESIKYKQVQYISKFLGEIFEANINGFIEKGMFVELKGSKVEGMVEFKTLGEYYIINDARNKSVGSKTRKAYKMGDKVKVRVAATDLERKRVDFELIDDK